MIKQIFALTFFLIPILANSATLQCTDILRTSEQFILPTQDEALLVELNAVDALRQMQMTTNDAINGVHKWLDAILKKNGQDQKISVMEYTTLLHLLKSGFLENLPDTTIETEVRDAVSRNWYLMTGSTASFDQIMNSKLPRSALKDASDRERKFHEAVFRSPVNAAVQEIESSKSNVKIRKYLGALVLVAIGFANSHAVSPEAQLLAGAVMGYTISSLAEWITHRYLLHSSPKVLAFLQKYGGNRATRAFRYHTGNHHAIFAGGDTYSSVENSEWQNATRIAADNTVVIERRDKIAIRKGDYPDHLHESHYGHSMNRQELATSTGLTVSVAGLMSYLLGAGPEATAAAIAVAPLTGVTTAYLHSYLHDPVEIAREKAGRLINIIMQSQYWASVSQRHRVHHIDESNLNFSLLLPGPDYFLGTLKDPDLSVLVKMDELGLAY